MLLPSASSTDVESVKFLKDNTKFAFKSNALTFDLALPMDLLIYSEDKWVVGRIGLLHTGGSANVDRVKKEEADEF